MAKGIRVSALAKELGVSSKAIILKCQKEDLGDKASTPAAVLGAGLEATVREWHARGEILEPEPEGGVAVATKTKTPRARKTKPAEGETEAATPGADEGAAAAETKRKRPARAKKEAPAPEVPAISTEPPPAVEAPVAAPEHPVAPVAQPEAAPVIAEPAAPAPPPAAPVAPPAPIEVPRIAAEAPAPVSAPVAPPVAAPPAPATPAAPPATPQAPARTFDPNRGTIVREAITMANRPQAQVERKPIIPAKKHVPREAVIAKPNIVRIEKPEPVQPPRGPRTPLQPPPQIGNFVRKVGGGVKISEEDEEKKKARTLSGRRRGADGRRGDAIDKIKEFSEQDLIDRAIRLNEAAKSRAVTESHLRKTEHKGQRGPAKSILQKGEPVTIEEPITVKTLSAALGVKVNDILGRLMRQGVFANLNQTLDQDAAAAIALDYGIELKVAREESMEDQLVKEFDARQPEDGTLQPRPPVVTILGHVDHGKTSLLDKIRNSNVAAGEAGGITQHTAAWMVEIQTESGRKRVTFIDTPGHQAFTSMRARGAQVTDVVVLVVSAAEGVQPQTVESINHARAAGVPIVVAMNKIDRADANPDMVLGQLAAQNLNPVEWGGDTEVIRTSATTGQGIKELIEILDYQSQLLDLKADPTSPARGAVIEANVDPGLGAVATVLVQDGTLRTGDVILSGQGYGRVRMLLNDRGESIAEAAPATPVIVSGLDNLPNAGDKFYVLDDADRARTIAAERRERVRQEQLGQANKVTLDNLMDTIKAGDVQTINLIIKADVQGSVETLVNTVTGQNTEEVKVKVIHYGVGTVTESDVELAMATKAKPTDNRVAIIGFNVVPDETARGLAEQNHIDVKTYRVIYEIFDDLKKALSGMLTPEEREKLHGHVQVRQLFRISKVGTVAGCMVTDGHVSRGSKIRLIRDGRVITEGLAIETLRRVKDDVKEVKSGFECGIKLAGYDDLKEGDTLEAYVKEVHERTL